MGRPGGATQQEIDGHAPIHVRRASEPESGRRGRPDPTKIKEHTKIEGSKRGGCPRLQGPRPKRGWTVLSLSGGNASAYYPYERAGVRSGASVKVV